MSSPGLADWGQGWRAGALLLLVLLVGVGDSGRQSCTRLAAFMSDYNVFQIKIAKGYGMVAFRDDLRKHLTNAGGKGEKSVTEDDAYRRRLDSGGET